MQPSLDERIEQFVRECGGWNGIGHVSDVEENGERSVLLVSRPCGLLDIWKVLRGKYLPRVAEWHEPTTPKE